MSLEIKYLGINEDAQNSMDTGSVFSSHPYVSNRNLLKTGAEDIPYATLEPGIWKLDGTRELLTKNASSYYGANQVIFWSTPIGDSMSFEIRLGAEITTNGITVRFSPGTNQWAKQAEVRLYSQEATVLRLSYNPDAPVYFFSFPKTTFDGFEIFLYTGGNPNEFIKVQKISVGLETEFGRKELSDVNLVEEVDPSLCELTADSLSFTVNTATPLPLAEGQRVELYRDGELQNVQFVKDFERRGKNQYRIICQSLIGTMDGPFYGKIYTPEGWPGYGGRHGNMWTKARALFIDIAESVNVEAQFETPENELAENILQNTLIAGYLPLCEQREALRQVSFASGLVPTTRTGTIQLVTLKKSISKVFGPSEILSRTTVRKLKPISKVSVTSLEEHVVNEKWTVYENKKIDGDTTITFDKITQIYPPPTWIWIDDEYGDIQDIVEEVGFDYGAGWVRYSDISPMETTRTADNYIEYRETEHTRIVNQHAKENVLEVKGTTLLFAGNVTDDFPGEIQVYEYQTNVPPVLDRLSDYAALDTLVEQTVIVTGQHAGDYVSTVTPWGTTVEGYIISMDSTMTQNGHTARIKILGKEVV